ncbi:MAG: TerB family tellurite resistance protein [Alphaproteobacteria bacterium]|nr:TerB family tellurite resistance protein [Alphaproteobacteria bacterium]
MNIWGIIIGGATGFAIGGPIGALLGAAAGHYAEAKFKGPSDSFESKKIAFTVAIIALSAKMAKADGVITRSEITAFRQKVHIPTEDLKRVGQFWDLARQTPDGFQSYAKQSVALFGSRAPILEQLLELLFFIAKADGEISTPEWNYLNIVSSIFGFDEGEFQRMADIYGSGEGAAHTILGIASDASEREIKVAWRKLVRENHPDKLISQGLPEEFVQAATDRLRLINAAYHSMLKRI